MGRRLKIHPQTKRLEELILSAMRVAVEPRIVEDSFPHYKRPSIAEMEFTIDRLIRDKTVPKELMVRIESKPTKEMLEDFCKDRNLSYTFDPIDQLYIFRLEKFNRDGAKEGQ